MVGTKVRDKMKDAIMANTTESAIGTNRIPTRQARRTSARKRWNAQRDTKAGMDDLGGAVQNSNLDPVSLFQMIVDVLDGDGRIVDENTNGQRQAA